LHTFAKRIDFDQMLMQANFAKVGKIRL